MAVEKNRQTSVFRFVVSSVLVLFLEREVLESAAAVAPGGSENGRAKATSCHPRFSDSWRMGNGYSIHKSIKFALLVRQGKVG